MTMRTASKFCTICEVLREINDLVQDNTPNNIEIRERLALAESMAKKMQNKLLEYNKEKMSDWWKKNPDYEESLRKRMSKEYVIAKDQ
jgi:predicted nuclease with TOPRIM domain